MDGHAEAQSILRKWALSSHEDGEETQHRGPAPALLWAPLHSPMQGREALESP